MKRILKGLLAVATVASLAACSQGVNFDLGSVADKFDQKYTYNNKVDILWIVDTSVSMDQHQQKLSAQIPDLVTALNQIKMDYHIAVVTTSMGGASPDGGKFMGSPKYLNSKSANLVSSLRSRLVLGSAGSNFERGLESMEEVFSPTYLQNEGKGFFRDDALLVVIALSNEDDKSSPTNPLEHYSAFLDSIKSPWKDGTRSWVFNFIGVLPNSRNCSTRGEYVEVGLNFISLVDFSGGVKASVCDNSLSSAITGIRAKVVQILTDFKLSKEPDLSTVRVEVNGKAVTRSSENGWDYIPDLMIIRFYGSAVPAADASIVIDFKPKEAN